MPSPQYTYSPAAKQPINWPKIILWVFGLLVLATIFVFFILNPLNLFSEKANDLYNETQNQGITVGEPNPNSYDCANDT